MGIETMGKVLVSAKIESLEDVYRAERGELPEAEIHSVEVDDALVDTGASILSMPSRLIRQLGLRPVRQRRVRTATGFATLQTYGAVRLTIQDRDCLSDVMELPDDCPVLIGQVPLELLDFVVDMAGRRLVGNPEHGGEHMLELF